MTPQLSRAEALSVRMHGHALWNKIDASPAQLVHRFVAMQAQENSYALWATAQRMASVPDASVLTASSDAGELLRTHVLRPTWHFVSPHDARWLLQLTGPRVHRINAPYLRREGLDERTLSTAFAMIETQLGEGHRTRAQLQQSLQASGAAFSGFAMGLVMMEAELRCLVISGSTLGKRRSYALFDERVPSGPGPFEGTGSFDREWALSELVGRFIETRGPATLKDFAVWSGLTLADTKTGLALARERWPGRFETVLVEDFECLWVPQQIVPTAPEPPRVDLVQGYDEYVMSYFPSKVLMQPREYDPTKPASTLLHTVLIDGVMAAQWKHSLTQRLATVHIAPVRALTSGEREAVETAASEYGRYLGLEAVVNWAD